MGTVDEADHQPPSHTIAHQIGNSWQPFARIGHMLISTQVLLVSWRFGPFSCEFYYAGCALGKSPMCQIAGRLSRRFVAVRRFRQIKPKSTKGERAGWRREVGKSASLEWARLRDFHEVEDARYSPGCASANQRLARQGPGRPQVPYLGEARLPSSSPFRATSPTGVRGLPAVESPRPPVPRKPSLATARRGAGC